MAQNDQALLTRLRDSGLEFVVIGGVCAVFHGAPVATFDLDRFGGGKIAPRHPGKAQKATGVILSPITA